MKLKLSNLSASIWELMILQSQSWMLKEMTYFRKNFHAPGTISAFLSSESTKSGGQYLRSCLGNVDSCSIKNYAKLPQLL